MSNMTDQGNPLTMKSEFLGGAGGVKPLNENHVKNCRFAASRIEILPMLPNKGRVAYLGMSDISFATEIARKTAPQEIHILSRAFPSEELTELRNSLKPNSLFLSNGNDAESYLAKVPDEYFDWIYFERPVGYKLVRENIILAEPKLKKNGIFVFRNYIFWMKNRKKCGVIPAVNEFVVNNNWEMIVYAFQKKGYADVAIRRTLGKNYNG